MTTYDIDTPIKEKRSIVARKFTFILERTEHWHRANRRGKVHDLISAAVELDIVYFLEWLMAQHKDNKKSVRMMRYALDLYNDGGDLDQWVKNAEPDFSGFKD